jgi:hypothetical protein
MTAIRILCCVFTLALGLTLHSAPAAAQPATISCASALDSYFTTNPADWLSVVGTRVSSRGSFGFSSFTMASGYSLSATPLNSPGAATSSSFFANRGSSYFEGLFHEVFPGRGNNDVDRWDFWIYRSGVLWLRSITWGGAWASLQGQTCFRGPQNQTVVTGYFDTPGFGTDFWIFVFRGDRLI